MTQATKQMKVEVAQLIKTYNEGQQLIIDAITSRQHKIAADMISLAGIRLMEISDELSTELTGVTLNDLVAKWSDHGYRPTLRGNRGTKQYLLANLYDLCAQRRCLKVTAYRGGF